MPLFVSVKERGRRSSRGIETPDLETLATERVSELGYYCTNDDGGSHGGGRPNLVPVLITGQRKASSTSKHK